MLMMSREKVRRRALMRAGWIGLALVLSGFGQAPSQAPEASYSGDTIWEVTMGHKIVSPEAEWPRVGIASWYSEQDPGVQLLTASGEPFIDAQMTAAIWNVPFGSCLQVVNLKTLERITVRVNDRGPHLSLASAGRVIDLSRAAFAQFADLDDGLVPVSIELASSKRCISAYASLDISSALP